MTTDQATRILNLMPGAYLEEDQSGACGCPFAIWAPVDDAGTLDIIGAGNTADDAIEDAETTIDGWRVK